MSVLTRAMASARPDVVRQLTDVDRRLRRPLALTARIGFVAAEPRSGCSTVAGGVARTAATRRSGRVLAVNMSVTAASVAQMVGCAGPARSTPEADEARRAATCAAAATAGLERSPAGVYCLDLHEQPAAGVSSTVRWWSALGPAARFFDVVVTDWGYRTGEDLAAVVASSRVVAVTARADREGMQRAVDLAAACVPLGVHPVVVLVDVAADRTPGIRAAVAAAPVPTVLVPHDAAVARGRRPGLGVDLALLASTAAALDALGATSADAGRGGERS